MKPLFGDQDYLEDKHLLIAVIAKDGDNESYGNSGFINAVKQNLSLISQKSFSALTEL